MQYDIELSFRSETLNLPIIQQLVGRCNGRFKFNPMILKQYSIVDIGFNENDDANKFMILKRIIEQPFF